MAKKYDNLGRGMDALINKVKATITSSRVADSLTEAFVREAVSMIVKRTRSGKGIDKDGGSLSPLKPLSKSYRDYRKAHLNNLSSFTGPNKSNLTFSAQLLNSMTHQKRSNRRWVITFEGTRRNGKRTLSNAQLAKYVSKERPFLYLAKEEIARIAVSYRRNFAALVRRGVK